MKKLLPPIPLTVKTKDDKLSPEIQDFVHEWVKANSDKINRMIYERIFEQSK